MAAENLSGVPPVVTLSGLQGGQSFSGQPQQSLSGQGGPGQGQGLPGMTGGLDLMQLLAMLGQGGGAGAGTDLGLTSPLSAGSFGQPGMGGFGQGMGTGVGMAPMGGQSTLAGATGQQGGTSGAGSIDPLSVLQKTLGLAQKGVGLFDTGTASPTLGDTGGASMSDQARSQQGGTGGISSIPFTASPTAGTDTAINSALNPPTGAGTAADVSGNAALQALPGGGTGGQEPVNLNFLNQSAGGQVSIPPELAALGVTPENYQQILANVAQAPLGSQITGTGGLGTGLGEIPGVGITGGGLSQGPGGATGGATGGASGLSGTNVLGGAQSGLSGLLGLLKLIQGAQGGNIPSAVGGGLQALGGAAGLGGLGGVGSATGGLGGLLGIAGGIQDLVNGNTGSGLMGLGTGALGAYGGLSALAPGTFTPLSELLGQALASYAPELAASLGVEAGATGAGAAGAAGAAAGAGAGAAGGVIAAPLLLDSLVAGLSGEQTGGIMGSLISGGKLDPYTTFNTRLGQNETQQGQGLNLLSETLPYAQSQQDIQNLIGQYDKFVPGGNEGLKQFMSPDPFTISAIPGVGTQTHGQRTQPVDWTGRVQSEQSLVNLLRQGLPATSPTPLDAGGLWNQIAENTTRQQAINSGLNLGQLDMMSPLARAQTLAQFQSPTPVTAPVSSFFNQLMMGGTGHPYQAPQWSTLPGYDASLLAPPLPAYAPPYQDLSGPQA
jgi:hypothetical protein